MKTALLKYTSVFFVYFIIDLTYQITFGMQFSQRIQEEAGIKEIVASEIQNPILILIWFAIMTTAIVKLAVEPAVEAKSIKKAVHKGVLLGVTSYATLALPNGWSLANYPLALVFEITMEGGGICSCGFWCDSMVVVEETSCKKRNGSCSKHSQLSKRATISNHLPNWIDDPCANSPHNLPIRTDVRNLVEPSIRNRERNPCSGFPRLFGRS